MNKTVAIALGLGGLAALVLAGGSGAATPSSPTPPSPGPTPPQKLPITVGPTLNLKNPSGQPANNNLLNVLPIPVPGVTPVTPVTPTPGSGGIPATARQTAAFNMAAAIQGNGYRQSDQAIYTAYQAAAGLTTDGFPGANTMNTLASDLQGFGQAWPFVDGYTATTVVVYPWSSSGTYDGTNAPPAAEWNR